MKKAFSVIIVIAILTIVGLIVYKNVDTSSLKGKEKITVTGYYGSEKEDFLKDQRVLKILKNKYGISLDLLKSGSMDMVELDLNKVDVVWPSSEIPVDQIKSKYGSKIRKSVSVGYSPMIVATWAPIKDLLQQNGLIKQENGINFIDIQKLIKLTLDNKKWNELNGSDKYYNSRKTVLIKTTDPNQSNSGLLYMALSSYIMNDFKVINDTTVSAVLQKIRPLFDLQGYKSSTSAIPWNDFLNKGRGDTPLVWIYEAQFINYVYQNGYKVGDTEIVQLYPEPTIWSNHVLLSLSDKGDKFVDALTTDEDLQKIFNEYGFRNNYKNGQYFYKYFTDKKVTIPENLNQVADPPQFSAMKSLLSYFK